MGNWLLWTSIYKTWDQSGIKQPDTVLVGQQQQAHVWVSQSSQTFSNRQSGSILDIILDNSHMEKAKDLIVQDQANNNLSASTKAFFLDVTNAAISVETNRCEKINECKISFWS